jgi:hypothetical protein
MLLNSGIPEFQSFNVEGYGAAGLLWYGLAREIAVYLYQEERPTAETFSSLHVAG